MQLKKDDVSIDSFTNSLSAIASIFALREILLKTDEQKALFESKRKKYMELLILDFVNDFEFENKEKFLESLITSNQL